jgi:hypothetical protein
MVWVVEMLTTAGMTSWTMSAKEVMGAAAAGSAARLLGGRAKDMPMADSTRAFDAKRIPALGRRRERFIQ